MNESTYPNGVGQMINTSGDSPILVLGAQLPGFPRPFSSLFNEDGETAICLLVDGSSYQIITVRWNAGAGTLTREAIYEGWKEGSSFSEMPLMLSGAARIIAGHSRQALDDYLASARINARFLTLSVEDSSTFGHLSAESISVKGKNIYTDFASLKMPLITGAFNVLLPNHSYILAPSAEADLPSSPIDGSTLIIAGDIGVDENRAIIKAQGGDTIAGDTVFSVEIVRRVFRLVYRSQNSDWGVFT